MARSRSFTSLGSSLCLALFGCSATHLTLGEDAGPSPSDAATVSGRDAGEMRVDAADPVRLDA